MEMKPNLKNARHLIAREIVLIEDAVHTLEVITQVYLRPSQGDLVGFALHAANKSVSKLIAIRYLLFTETPFANEQATALTDSFGEVEEFEEGVTTYQDFLGADVVTEAGKLCGRIEEVYFEEESMQTIYKVKRPGLKGVFGRKFYLVGKDCAFYSHRYRRLIPSAEAVQYNSLLIAAKQLGLLKSPLALEAESFRPELHVAQKSRVI